MKIGRTIFWFKDGEISFNEMTTRFYGLATLLNRLMNEKYDGKKIEFINIDFKTPGTYELFPTLPKDAPYYYGGHLKYYAIWDLLQFDKLDRKEQGKYLWDKSYEYLSKTAKIIKNNKLLEAVEYAHAAGIELNLDPDYSMIESSINISGQDLKASVWVNFRTDATYAKLVLQKDGIVVFEKDIDKVVQAIDLLLEAFKAIDVEDDQIIIKGLKDAGLPLKIPLAEVYEFIKPR